MSEPGKITASHLSRTAVIYVRQSTLVQVERNTESTARQYDLVSRARQLGWPQDAIRVVDGDLGVSGSVTGQRDGFEGVVAEVALGQVQQPVPGRVIPRERQLRYRLPDVSTAVTSWTKIWTDNCIGNIESTSNHSNLFVFQDNSCVGT